MGRKKIKRKIIKFKQPKVPIIFDCPFCNIKNCISIKMGNESSTNENKNNERFNTDYNQYFNSMNEKGDYNINCSKCHIYYNSKSKNFTEPIDAYCEWIDLCENLNENQEN